MKHIISCSAAAMAKVSPLEDCVAALAGAGFDTIDFWLYRYSEGKDAPMLGPGWRDWVRRTRDTLAEAGLSVGQAHALWNHGGPIRPDLSVDPPTEIFYRSIEAAWMLGCRRLIFHPQFYGGRVDCEALRTRLLDINAAWFSALLPTAERFDVELHLENTFDFNHVQQPGDGGYQCTTAAEMVYLAEKLDHPLVKLCLDTGHANIAGQDVPAMIRAFGRHLGSLHLNDNYGRIGPIYEDLHLFPGYGRIDWDGVMEALRETGYAGTMNLEPTAELPRADARTRVIQLRAAREVLEAMAEAHDM